MKKHKSTNSSKKRLKNLCRDIAEDLTRWELDQETQAPSHLERERQERRELFLEVQRKLKNLSS